MPEYLRVLHERFTTASSNAAKIQRERDRILARLREQLGKSQRILLLHLLDLEDDLREQKSILAFAKNAHIDQGQISLLCLSVFDAILILLSLLYGSSSHE